MSNVQGARPRRLFAALFIAFISYTSLTHTAHAQDPLPDYLVASKALLSQKKAENMGLLQPLDTGLLGDRIDPATGSLSFYHNYVSLPGNSSLPVSYGRVLKDRRGWLDDVPTIRTKLVITFGVDDTRDGEYWHKNRCTGPLPTPVVRFPANYFFTTMQQDQIRSAALPTDVYHEGVFLETPGGNSRPLLRWYNHSGPDQYRVNGQAPTRVTADNWRITCIPDIGDNRGEGFIATAPDGTRYRFDKLFYHELEMSEAEMNWQDEHLQLAHHQFQYGDAIMRASEMTDVHGNWVRYEYDRSGMVTRIHSNDDRVINVSYLDISNPNPNPIPSPSPTPANSCATTNTSSGSTTTPTVLPNPLLTDAAYDIVVTANEGAEAREWRLEKRLTGSYKVILPDGTFWDIRDSDWLYYHEDPEYYCAFADGGENAGIFMKHPNGTEGVFDVGPVTTMFANPNVNGDVGKYTACAPLPESNGYLGNIKNIRYIGQIAAGIYAKTLTIPGANADTLIWHYDYEGQPSGPAVIPDQAWRTVTHPDGSIVRNWVNRTRIPSTHTPTFLYGKIQTTEMFAGATELSNNTPMEVVNTTYTEGFPLGLSNTYRYASRIYTTYQAQQTVTRGPDVYTTDYTYNEDRSSPAYSFEKPISVSKHSNLGSGTRTTDITYQHLKDQWILALPTSITRNNVPFASAGYDSNGKMVWQNAFGTRVRNYTYHPDGNLHTASDALNRTTTLTDYKRGTPQRVTRPDGYWIERDIDDNGWTTRFRGTMGYEERYTHNDVGWLTGIDRVRSRSYYPDWSDTTIEYSGLGSGITQTETRGAKQTITTYDGLQRPTDVRVHALYGGGEDIFSRTEYDSMGRVSFSSLPSAYSNPSDGIETTYDALGRVLSVAENMEPFAITTNTYLSGNSVRVRDPMNNLTTTTKSGYGSPDDGQVTLIQSPLDTNTAMSYDIYGNMLSVRQYGTQNSFTVDQTQLYSYDNRYRLCRHYTPETGSKLFEYDTENQLTAYAEGQSGTTGCASLPSAARVALSYDNMGRSVYINYPDSTLDIAYDYPTDSEKTVYRGDVYTGYNYNDLGLLAGEYFVDEIGADARSYSVQYGYNPDGALTRRNQSGGYNNNLTAPTRVLDFAPNGLGQSTHVQEVNGPTYASGITYHPNGGIKHLNFGNGRSFDRSLNASQLPSQLSYANGFTWNYDYDANKRITSINDSADNNYDRTLGYDGLNRLTSANSPAWGNANYTYDAIGNLRLRQLGSRTVNIGYDGQNRLSSANDSANGNWGYSYDTKGNVINDGRRAFTYDAANQPTTITGPATGNFVYDGNLKRIEQVIDGKQIYSVYGEAGGVLFRHNVTDNKKIEYLSVSGMSIVKLTNGTPTYQYTDHLGSTIMEADASGNVIASSKEQYAPFGEKLNNAASNQDDVSFTGHIEDSAIGLTYMQARYYDPVVGRFLSNDPKSYSNIYNFNRYAYANNNPYLFIDPDGKEAFSTFSQMSDRDYEAHIWATGMGYENEADAQERIPEQAEQMAQEVRNIVHDAADATSKVTAGLAVTSLCCIVTSPAAIPLTTISGVSGAAAALTDKNPATALATEVVTMGLGKKVEALGDATQLAGKLSGDAKSAITNGVETATSEKLQQTMNCSTQDRGC